MEDKVVRIDFNVWANDDSEAETLKKAIFGFINEHGNEGRKVTAAKLANAISKWKDNAIVRNSIINYFR